MEDGRGVTSGDRFKLEGSMARLISINPFEPEESAYRKLCRNRPSKRVDRLSIFIHDKGRHRLDLLLRCNLLHTGR